LLSSSDLPTLQLATLENLQRVASLGINTALSFDTQRDIRSVLEFFFKDKLGFLPNLGIGFVKLSTGQSLVYMSNGMLTAQGMTLINVINRFVDSNYQKGILYVDGSYPTVLGVRIAREILGIPAINIAGAAIGFNGEIASGSNGNSISIEEIIALSTKVSVQLEISYEASLTLVKRVLTRMLFSMQYISTLHPGEPAAEPFYDFKDKKSFERFVMQSAFECITSDRKIDLVVKYLEGSITDFQGGEGVVKKELIGKLHAIPTMKPDTILRRISVQKIQPPQKINADMFKICGYDDLESEVLASKAKSGEIFICRRSHPFMDFVIMLLSLNKRDLDSLSPEEKETLKQAILIVKRIF